MNFKASFASRLPMIHQNSLRFYEDIAYDTYNGLVLDDSEGKKLAGDKLSIT